MNAHLRQVRLSGSRINQLYLPGIIIQLQAKNNNVQRRLIKTTDHAIPINLKK
jgi:hypothetical protein